ncbi:bcl-2-interacting killer isoform X1 [Oryctolagus cuniculus]|uniref:bcl-2-interacting killer isoform X1 n=1 Tax=Oryctolagus cuniculus TaxID=9986 RepID=UPI00387A5038
MSEVRPGSRDLFQEALLDEQVPEPLLTAEVPGLTRPVEEGDLDLMECLEGSNQVALRLAYIGDEMDLHVRGLHLAQLPGVAMHSLAFTYSQTGFTGVLGSVGLHLASLVELWSPWVRAWGAPWSRFCLSGLPLSPPQPDPAGLWVGAQASWVDISLRPVGCHPEQHC